MNRPNQYKEIIANIANKISLTEIMTGAEKKADDIMKELDLYCDGDKNTYFVARILIQEIIFELKLNEGKKERIQFWLLIQDFVIKKYYQTNT